MNKAVEIFQRYPFRAVVLSGFAALAGFLLLNTVGFPGSSWDACEDARIRQREAQTDTMFMYARNDVEKFCPPTASQTQGGVLPGHSSDAEIAEIRRAIIEKNRVTHTPYVPLKVGSTASIITGTGSQLGYKSMTNCRLANDWSWDTYPVDQGTEVTVVERALSCDPYRYQVRLPDGILRWFKHDQLTQ